MRCLPGAVRCPGDPEKACEEEARARGVVLHEGTATALKALAGRYGVETPPEFAALDASRSVSDADFVAENRAGRELLKGLRDSLTGDLHAGVAVWAVDCLQRFYQRLRGSPCSKPPAGRAARSPPRPPP